MNNIIGMLKHIHINKKLQKLENIEEGFNLFHNEPSELNLLKILVRIDNENGSILKCKKLIEFLKENMEVNNGNRV